MRLIDADALIQSVGDKWTDYDRELVDSFPTIDAVPVVRCRECEFGVCTIYNGFNVVECNQYEIALRLNDYCSQGQRREDGDA